MLVIVAQQSPVRWRWIDATTAPSLPPKSRSESCEFRGATTEKKPRKVKGKTRVAGTLPVRAPLGVFFVWRMAFGAATNPPNQLRSLGA